MTEALPSIELARAYLSRVAEPPAPALVAFVARHGPQRSAVLIRSGEVPAEVAKVTTARAEVWRPEADLRAAAEVGARLLTPEDDEWPAWRLLSFTAAAIRGKEDAAEPVALWVRGDPDLARLTEQSVAIVGARAATGYGEHVSAEFAHGLARRGFTVISGAAYGIDGAAHGGALAAGGQTVAVLACGVDIPYPAGHARLLDRIASAGAVVSEYPPGTRVGRHRFLVRNRLIAALAEGTVVVEAGLRSGASNTAATARTLGRMVLAVPGPITSAMSVGCHAMLREGEAQAVTSAAEVAESIGRIGGDLTVEPEAPVRPTDALDPRSLRVHQALRERAGSSPEQVSMEAGIPIGQVRAVLPMLELAGLAQRGDTGWRRCSGRSAPSRGEGGGPITPAT
ncbi:DNA-processing protein DprA [Allokutzneria sp. A3M-2-11 16]|uniref:DNA-processing protein DprA n=1 Tax=Allokutzneria sp. A3M-2-11 16 TaxID=2962043 RepID=UPI0020B6417B|nr:DNA-processing protein DprA [Allokutzneria sp. A3M-2-11 16]MCP3797948.1 DNA-processing protein DprA [Allokutzneria sp. A3M-2-11 16]